MLFNSLVPQVFQSMALDAYSLSNSERKQEAAKRIDFYHGEQLPRLLEQLEQLFSDPSSMVLAHLNLTKKIINQLAQVYRLPPKRLIEGSEKDKTLYQEIVEQCGLDVKLKSCFAIRQAVEDNFHPTRVWRNGKLDLDILTGDFVDVITGDTPEDLREVLITDYGTGQIQDVTFSHWTPELWRRLDYNSQRDRGSPEPLSGFTLPPDLRLPAHRLGFWLPGGSDLISIQEAVNLKLTDLLHLLSNQSFGVGYIKGSSGGANLKVDPGSLIELPENGEIGFRSQEAQISEVVNAIDKLVKWACVSQGLSAAIYVNGPFGQAERDRENR